MSTIYPHFYAAINTLERALRDLDFDASRDRLFGVGDLVGRGPHPHEALVWLESRFEAVVMGNHERPLLYWFDPHRRPSLVHRPQWLRRVPRTQLLRAYQTGRVTCDNSGPTICS